MKKFDPNLVEKTVLKINSLLNKGNIPYAFIGAFASSLWGIPRLTRDLDLLILTAPERLNALLEELVTSGFQIDHKWEKHNPMIRHLQTRLKWETIAVDLLLPRDDFDKEILKRRKKVKIYGQFIYLPCAEDLILMKLRLGRPRDFDDAINVAKTQKLYLNLENLEKNARRLGITEEWQFILSRLQDV